MTEMTVILTKTDRAILNSYKKICEGLSAYLGDGYEIVLHSLENFDHSVIQILNGSHTGRTIGAPITDLALTMLSQIRTKNDCGYICYHSKNKEGQPLKSTTITIAGENDRIIGLLCINFYLNTPLAKVLEQLMFSETQIREIAHPNETYVDRVDDLILQTVMQVRAEVMEDNLISTSNKNKEIIKRLISHGIFNLKDSVIKCAKILGISKNTIYLHLRNINQKSEQINA